MLIALDEDEAVSAGHMAEDLFVRQMKHLRGARGISQAELAERVVELGGNLYQQTIAKIESGQRAVRLQEADLIAQALRSSVQEMLSAATSGDEESPDSNPESMPIEALLTRVRAASRRRDGLAQELRDARRVERQARDELAVAQARADAYLAAARRAQLHHDEAEAELRLLTRISLQRQSEFNREYGPRWREKLSTNPPLTVDMITEGRKEEPDADLGEEDKK